VHPDRCDQIEAVGFEIERRQVAAQGGDVDPFLLRQCFGFAEPYWADVLGADLVPQLREEHRIAPFSFGEAKGLAGGETSCVLPEEIVGLLPIHKLFCGKALVPVALGPKTCAHALAGKPAAGERSTAAAVAGPQIPSSTRGASGLCSFQSCWNASTCALPRSTPPAV